jgi:hypothetical protein
LETHAIYGIALHISATQAQNATELGNWLSEISVGPFPVSRKKVSNQFQCAEKSVDPFPVCLSNYFMLVNFVEPFPVEYEFEPFPVKLSNHFSAPLIMILPLMHYVITSYASKV